MPSVNPEFALVAACCRWPPSPQRNAAITMAAATPIDWSRFAQVVKRQRVPGLVWNGLSQAGVEPPPVVAATLKAVADRTARTGLAFCAEVIRLQRSVREAGCECAFVKGSTLAVLAYGNFGIRHAKDIDMVVPMADLQTVCALLSAAGYRQIRPAAKLSDSQFGLWRIYGKDMEWYHDAKGIGLELHWRLTELSFFPAARPDFATMQSVALTPTERVKTLPTAALFTYLCVHGAAHGWMRLKWLADVHALLADQGGSAIEQYYQEAAALGLGRAVGQALLLCADLFELPLPANLSATLRTSRVATLSRIGTLSMMRGHATAEVHDLHFGTTLISLSHLLLAQGLRAKVAEVVRKGINLDDVLTVPLPARLAFLYWFLRGPLWMLRRAKRGGVVKA